MKRRKTKPDNESQSPNARRLKTKDLAKRFTPRFWEQADSRLATIREMRHRYDLLKADCQADSYQKDLLCQRATFVAAKLETMEVTATETGEFDMGVYTQAVNCLLGLLRSLGLERKAKNVQSLESYVKSVSQKQRKR